MASEIEQLSAVGALRTQVDEMADRNSITDVSYRYALALDMRDYDALHDVFTPDASMITLVAHGAAETATFNVPLNGCALIKERCSRILDGMRATQHATTHAIIQVDGDEARTTTHLHEQHYYLGNDGPGTLETGGIYRDRWSHTTDDWRIVERTLTPLYWHGDVDLIAQAMARSDKATS